MGAALDKIHTPVGFSLSGKKGDKEAPPAEVEKKEVDAERPPQAEHKLKQDTETAWMDFAKLSTDFQAEYDKVKAELAAKQFAVKPYARQMVAVAEEAAKKEGGGLTFTMMQFNVLADGLSGSRDDVSARKDAKGFIKSPHDSLPWRVRGFAIVDEILRHDPDVVCLEEVDQFKFLQHFLAPQGYEGRGKAKDKSPCVKVGKKYGLALPPDGTAIFWKKAKFELVQAHEAFPDMPHEQAVQVVELRAKGQEQEQRVVVAVMHLKSKKAAEGERLRLEQLLYLMPELKRLAKDLPVFIGCDLNAESGCTPIGAEECEYEPYAYQSLLGPDALRRGAAQEESVRKLLDEQAYEDGYGLALASAYREASSEKEEPLYTTWKERDSGNAKHTIDYLFFQPRKGVSVTHVLSIPTEAEVNQDTYLPGWEYPSDHFAIQATFQVNPR